jgi:cytoskeleton protein RodZ
MSVFGDRMRREREMRGVTLEEISESTKISKRALQALEEEDFDLLPGGIFNKGFVRAYARFLGIDEEQAVADFVAADAGNHETQEKEQFPLRLEDRPAQPPLNPKRSLAPVMLAILLLAAAAGGWTLWNKYKSQHVAQVTNDSQDTVTTAPTGGAPQQPPSGQGSQTNATNNNDAVPAPSPTPEKKNDPDQKTASPGPSLSSNDSGKASKTAANDSTNKQASPSDSTSSDSTPVSKQPFTISIKATEDSWISIVADGKPKLEGILSAEKQRSVSAGKELVLVTGNAGGIEVSYNGKPIAPLGKKQQKRTVTFTPQGLKE